jgi:ATP-dependent RNA helicase DeaD
METKQPINFTDLGISEGILKAIDDMGFEEPSPIQKETIPVAMKGGDLIGQAQTGTGKTVAFAIPLLMALKPNQVLPQVLVMTPTRELAIQVAEEFTRVAKYTHSRVLPIYGGQNIGRQIKALQRGVDVVVGTPGRVLDHLGRKTLKLGQLQAVVLDEADEMLDMGFIEDIEAILATTPEDRQTMLFSATIPASIARLAAKYMEHPKHIEINPEYIAAPDIKQVYYELRSHDRFDVLCRIIDAEAVERAIIFCRTKRGVDELAEALQTRGYQAEAIHGDMEQNQRQRVMKNFKDGDIDLLVATDVAARGIDVQNVSHVINYDCPQDPESYVHRIGRTGRAGHTGTAITLVHPKELSLLKTIQRTVKVRIERRQVPSQEDVAERQREIFKGRLTDAIDTGNLGSYRAMVEELADEFDTLEIAAAAIKLLAGNTLSVDMSAPRGDKPDQEEEVFHDTGAEEGMVRFFMNAGRKNGISPADVVRNIAEQADIPGRVIGVIDIYEDFTFVEVPEEVAKQVSRAMRKTIIKGSPVNLEPARPR